MTSKAAGEQPIVIHPPRTGDPDRIAQAEDWDLEAPPPARELPPAIRERAAEVDARRAAVAHARTRVFGLDAVRGICLLLMNLTFALPSVMLLPAWMYHTQYPPPTGDYVPLPGLTWQDIIFPGFLFAMAAAVPIRSAQLLAAGESRARIAWGAVQRTALLYVFSLIIAHVNPFYTKEYTKAGNLLAIAGFITCFLLFVRPRPEWNPRVVKWVRRIGWVGAAVILFVMPPSWGGTFSILRRDNIITSIAFTYLLCSVIWLLTRDRPLVRVALMALLAISKLLAPLSDAVATAWGTSLMAWLYEPWYIELLLIAIPGTIAGDLLLRWSGLGAGNGAPAEARPTGGRLTLVAVLGFITPFVYLFGLYHRKLIATTVATVTLVALGGLLLSRGRSPRDQLLLRMGTWTGALLIVGDLLEPLEGGIKKDPQTLSFLILCGGIWFAVLLAATIVLDLTKGVARRIAQPVVLVGQNAMLAYVIFMLFLNHIAYYLGFGDFLSATPGQSLARGVIVTTAVAASLWLLTRYRIVWRT